MIELKWSGSANGNEPVYILIAPRTTSIRLLGRFTMLRNPPNDKEAGLTFNLHIQDSKLREPFWVITDVYGYKNAAGIKLCRVTLSDQKWWAVLLPKGSFTGLERILFDGVFLDVPNINWIVKSTGDLLVTDCKNWSLSTTTGEGGSSGALSEIDPIFKKHPTFNITQDDIDDFHKALSLDVDLTNGLYLNELDQKLGLNLATQEEAGAMSAEDKIKLDSLEIITDQYYPLYDNPAGYLTQESDPIFSLSPASQITALDITRWNDTYYWGDHSIQGYLKDYTETDPIFRSSPAYSINHGQIILWTEAALRRPVDNHYINAVSMIANIANQTAHHLYYVVEEDTYYEYLGTTNYTMADYRVVGGINNITIVDTDNVPLPNRGNLQFIRLDVEDDIANNKTTVTRPPAVVVASSVPTQQILEGDVWINNITWKIYVYYDQFWVETGKNISEFLGTGFTEIDPIFQASVAASITQQDIDNWNNMFNEVLNYRSVFETDGRLYSGYLFNGTPTITRLNNNVLENAINLTNLELDWSNRLTLTYTV